VLDNTIISAKQDYCFGGRGGAYVNTFTPMKPISANFTSVKKEDVYLLILIKFMYVVLPRLLIVNDHLHFIAASYFKYY
jgi:hypothetical protein